MFNIFYMIILNDKQKLAKVSTLTYKFGNKKY